MKTILNIRLFAGILIPTVLFFGFCYYTNYYRKINYPVENISAIKNDVNKTRDVSIEILNPEAPLLTNLVTDTEENQVQQIKHTKVFQPLVSPLPALNIQPVVYTIDASPGELITTNTKSVIQIPPNCFVDKNGNEISGKVDVSFREFHNTWDMFVSGIPMHYDSGGFDLLESAGMFEIDAAQNGEPVFINPQKQINVRLTSTNSDEDFNTYYFDKTKNNWVYKNRNDKQIEATNSVLPRRKQISINRTIPGYVNIQNQAWISSNTIIKQKRKGLFGPKTTPIQFIFKIQTKKNIPTELKFIRNTYWVYEGNDAKDLFRILFNKNPRHIKPYYKKLIRDIRIEEFESKYKMIFMAEDTPIEIEVHPFIKNKKDEEKFNGAFANYTTIKESRYPDTERKIYVYAEDSTAFDSDSSFGGNENKLIRLFQVNNFGFWNCDRPIKTFLPVITKADFINEKGKKINIKKGYMVFENRNTILPVDIKSSFRYNPYTNSLFWAVINDKEVAIVNPEELSKKRSQQGNTVFNVRIIDYETSKEELKKSLKSLNVPDQISSATSFKQP